MIYIIGVATFVFSFVVLSVQVAQEEIKQEHIDNNLYCEKLYGDIEERGHNEQRTPLGVEFVKEYKEHCLEWDKRNF